MEKKTESLKAAAEKAAQNVQALSEKLEAAQKELAAKGEDEKLKKQVEGLVKAVEAAKQKEQTAFAALKAAEELGGSGNDENTSGNKIRLKIRNKTGRPTYYRAGLCFAQAEAEYEVSQDIAEVLKADGWLIVEEVK